MRAGIYARVSTASQDTEVQLRELRSFVEGNEWAQEIYADPAVSGARVKRPQLDRLLADCRRRKNDPARIDVVVIYRLDRLARSVKQLVDLALEFEQRGVQLVSLHEKLDTTTAQGKLMFHFFAAIAEFERALIRERVMSGLALAREKGKVFGRPKLIDVALLESVRQRRAAGEPWEAIAAAVGVSRHTCRRAFLEAQNAQNPPSGAVQ